MTIYIIIEEHRIKRSNIKAFGVSVQAGIEKKLSSKSIPEVVAHAIKEKFSGRSFWRGYTSALYIPSIPSMRYLYIKTYQNDNYQFFENQINIDEVMKDLEKHSV